MHPTAEHTVSIIIPVYSGEVTLAELIEECVPLLECMTTPRSLVFRVIEVILVWDRGPDRSDEVMRRMADYLPQVKPVWLARNVGQHAATCAGIAASQGEWVVTMDEDGHHDPAEIARLLDEAFQMRARLVYAEISGATSHGRLRDLFSRWTKAFNRRFLSEDRGAYFSSFRLIHGESARVTAAMAGPTVYLDAALSWSLGSSSRVLVRPREERRSASGYTPTALRRHFARLVGSAGPRPLKLIAGLGATVALTGVAFGTWVVVGAMAGTVEVAGWASLMATILFIGGLLLLATSVVAAYLAVALRILLGQPLFTAVDDDNEVFGP